MKLLRFLLVFLFAVALSGCAARVKNVTDLPPGVTQKQAQDWDVAVQRLGQIATVTTTARQAIIGVHQNGLLPDGPNYVNALTAVGKIDEIQLAASNVLKQAPNNFSDPVKGQVKDYMTQIAAQVQILNQSGVTGIKNPNSKQQIGDLITQITGFAAMILSL
jgi:hypothetical protein